MKALGFYIFFSINWVITLLPIRVLYLFSYLFYIFLAWVPGYRKEIIMKNLRNSFPEKSEDELKKIRSRFYLHFADLFVESLKIQHLSKKNLQKRYKINNPEILDRLHKEGKNSITVLGHYANWEWIIISQVYSDYKFLTVYKPLSNKYFDRFLLNIRTRYGMELVPMSNTLRTILNYSKKGIGTTTALVSDQTPPRGEIQFWTKFLNQDTAVYLGIEKLSRKFNMTVLFFNITMVKRGFYEVDIEVLTEEPKLLKEFELTEMHIKRLEEKIVERPELWLWSHRRWKHKKPVENG
jgi:KDO2-lipid IV(A) lauroyltransferase